MSDLETLIKFAYILPKMFWVDEKPLPVDWSIVDISDIVDLPKKQGIYFVISGDDVLYVGKAGNLYERWRTGHHKTVKFFKYEEPAIMFIITPDYSRKELADIESYYIRKHKPLEQG